MTLTPKPKRCKVCRESFTPLRAFQKVCGIDCSKEFVRRLKEKSAKEERREDKAKLQAAKPLSHWLNETQKAVNEYIRERDANLPCVSCGTMTSAMWDAGHFYSRGARPNLRFEPLNIHKQCSKCNRFASADVQAAYRAEIERRIGLDMLQALERDQEPRKWTREELAELRAHYRAKTRELRVSTK